MFIPIILYVFVVLSREFRLIHSDFFTTMGSWAAVEPNGMGLPSRFRFLLRLGALLPSPKRVPNILKHQRL